VAVGAEKIYGSVGVRRSLLGFCRVCQTKLERPQSAGHDGDNCSSGDTFLDVLL
jgi:hypothetical protein